MTLEEAEIHNDVLAEAISCFIVENDLLDENSGNYRIDCVNHVQDDGTHVRIGLGIGTFPFTFKKQQYKFNRTCTYDALSLNQRLGDCSVATKYHETITVCGPGILKIHELCSTAHELQDKEIQCYFRTYVWQAETEHWRQQAILRARDWSTVIMDERISKKLYDDVTDFTGKESREWYEHHSIPYKRGYLLYGPPGTGKTSTVSALASLLKRNVCRINLVESRLTDVSLHCAITNVRENSIVVMEDVDCLFGTMREKKEEFHVTFSGFLNAIDGLQCAKGLVFVFTSNHPDRLDPALRRKGRIDVELAFGMCTTSQIKKMFYRFYPNASEEIVQKFVTNVLRVMPSVSPASLQEFFIRSRKLSSEEAAENVSFEEQLPERLDMWS